MAKLTAIVLVVLSIGIFCGSVSSTACTYLSVRLFNGKTTSSRGFVQVCNSSGLWSDVCDYWWSHAYHTRIVCRQLGYTNSYPITSFNNGPALSGKFSFMSSSSSGTCSYSTIGNCLTSSYWRLSYSSYCNVKKDTVFLDCNPQTSCAKPGVARLFNLTGNKASNEGMLQICDSNKKWTAVCDYNWGCSQSVTACRQLGHKNPYPTYENNGGGWTKFGFGPYSYCSSSYTRLTSCSAYSSSYRTNTGYCNPTHDTVRLNCNEKYVMSNCSQEYGVRLVGGKDSSEGRVEVCRRGYWRSTCATNVYINSYTASTICNQLGYTSHRFATVIRDGRYGKSLIKHHMTYMYCYGTYPSLRSCSTSHSSSKCSFNCQSYYTGVKCYESDNCEEGAVRLVNGTEEGEGRLEVCTDGVWGLVCTSGFRKSAAYIACKQLGFTESESASIYYGNKKYGTGDRPIVYSYVNCYGSESKLADCSKSVFPSFDCNYPNIIGLKCLDSCEEGQIRLVGGPNELEGTVEICNEKRWQLISDIKWDEKDATVVCRQLDHAGGSAVLNSKYGKPKRALVYSRVGCRGTEAQLRDCAHKRLSVGVMEGTVAGVRCSPGAGSKVPDYIVTKVACNNTEFALKGCSQICSSRTTNCVGSKVTKFGTCICSSCTEPRNQPSQALTVTLDDAKNYRCNEYCTKMKKCFDGSCDKTQNACVCHYCQPEEIINYLKEVE